MLLAFAFRYFVRPAEHQIGVRLSILARHYHVDDGIDAGRQIDQQVGDNVQYLHAGTEQLHHRDR
uniref:Uncharacterized protein n=1 Tax=Anopheles christyi TaxID=43041 RepID=A0A182KIS1_9DIPT